MNALKKISIAALAALSMVAPAFAQDATVEGVWKPDANSDYEVSLCGDDSSRLCIKVLELRGKMRKAKNLPYLGTNIVDQAKKSGANQWKGKVSLFGVTGDAVITYKNSNTLHLKACAYLVVCDEITLTRKS